MGQDPQEFNFLSLNIIIVGIAALVAFGYLLMIIRKRWKQNFLHREGKTDKS